MKILALLLAGSFFLGGCGGRVRRGVVISGVDVGGMTYAEAEEAVRSRIARKPLTVLSPAGRFDCPVEYSDNVQKLLKKGRGNYEAEVRRQSVLLEDFADMVCRENFKASKDATVTFSESGFSYTPGECGLTADFHRLAEDLARALETGDTTVRLSLREVEPAVTTEMLGERTRLLAAFSTRYNASDEARSRNLALAASKISGTTLESGETFSFNARVGKRTRENGFFEAPVIEGGEFVFGVGGGVCQASTTLFGAALRAGLEVIESHPHSLAVSYVAPSQDAMVSEYSDLRFRNLFSFPVYLAGKAEGGVIAFFVYGKPQGLRYEVESRECGRIPAPAPKIVEGTRDRTLRVARDGLRSESYLLVYEEETLLSRTLLRRDVYASVQGIEERALPQTPEDILEGEAALP